MRINIRPNGTKLKPTFRIGKKAEPASPFQALVKQASEAWHRLEQLRAPGALKLSRDAFLRESLKCNPDATLAGVQKLKRKLESADSSLGNTRSALRKMVKELRGPNLRTPPTAARWEERSRNMFLQPRVTEVLSELTAVGSNTIELFGVAILQAGDVFGSGDGEQRDADAKIAAAEKELADLFKRIERSWTSEDIDPGRYDGRGHTSPATFKGTDVPVAGDNAAERLLKYIRSQRDKQT